MIIYQFFRNILLVDTKFNVNIFLLIIMVIYCIHVYHGTYTIVVSFLILSRISHQVLFLAEFVKFRQLFSLFLVFIDLLK